ncbi:hypothetical protein BVC80_1519g30 [Macleaya cordata]|uniref:EDRF1 N-terminal domain-containing protein n=1 Tax=Macleaya cordata TaxID=56857 RepID=A0A200PTJ7_MACCD|nr:hypothetical protein BVC80_1519g30 [Macleaya cordata]
MDSSSADGCSSSSSTSWGELQCVGRLEIVRPKPVGFLCGTLPVPTDEAFNHAFNSALIPSSSSSSVKAPRYRMLPTETDLNTPPLLPNLHEKDFPVAAVHSRVSSTGADLHRDSSTINQNLARKSEALAVYGLSEYGDEIDVVAPTDILKQIFKMPYSKGRLSVAVQRIGNTLVLNTGPDIEEGERLVRRHSNQAKSADQSLFLNFAMHSVRAEACDIPPNQYVPSEEQSNSSILPGQFEPREGIFVSSDLPAQGDRSQFLHQSGGGSGNEGLNRCSEYPQVNQENYWGSKHSKRSNRHHAVKKASQVGEKSRCPIQESEKYRRVGNDGFLRVLFWQFHNFRMLLGSDLLLFSNEKYVAVSLHLWDVARQVTPLTWLEAWLDNIMASVPELAICYHQNGVVQGYELLKTDDIFLLKGISEDGTPAFHPQVVQQNGLSVLRFLQDNCKQDPGAYWLYKSAGEDAIQLFDLSVIPKNHSSDDHDRSSSSLPSLMHGRRDSLFSLGTLLYRLAHRLSLSMATNSRAKCARLFRKCLDFLDEQDHLVVRALAHEQFARLILKCYEELDLTSEFVPLESEVTVTDAEDESPDYSLGMSGSDSHGKLSSEVAECIPSTEDGYMLQESESDEASAKLTLDANSSAPRKFLVSGGMEERDPKGADNSSSGEDILAVYQMSETTSHVVQTVADPISSKLAAVHHVSQAIKSLRWKRQLQKSEAELVDHGKKTPDRSSPVRCSLCVCGDSDCIEVCDIREWLPKSKMDHKLWKLVLLLGESYLALGQAYMEDGQLHQALKVVDIACSVYGSMPQHVEDAQFISSMVSSLSSQTKFTEKIGKTRTFIDDTTKSNMSSSTDYLNSEGFSSTYLFWANAWTLVGDVYVEYHLQRSKDISVLPERKACTKGLRMSSDVVKEVKRLKKKLGQFKQSCSTCYLINCSCQSDRANSGNSASSSSGNARSLGYGRKQNKRSQLRNSLHSVPGSPENDHSHQDVEITNNSESECLKTGTDRDTDIQDSNTTKDKLGATSLASNSRVDGMGCVVASSAREAPKARGRSGGIFEFLEGPIDGDAEYNLSVSISCYDAARKALAGLPTGSAELQSILKKQGWACNELGRNRLDRKELGKAELAFVDAIKAFKEVSDHTNIILINCNLGHGRRALAEEMVFKMENLKAHALLQNAYKQALETAKLEYSEALRYYGAARLELDIVGEGAGLVTLSSSLRSEVYTQFANTYLRLGMLLAREDISAEVYENGAMEDLTIGHVNPCDKRTRKEMRKHEISANDAIREALCMYESLGELRKQEAAYAYFQLACYHRDCCLRFLHQIKLPRSESSILHKVKQYASLAERSWQKSINFYGPKTHSVMYLTVLIERSALPWKLSESFHSNAMMESALSRLFEGRHVSGGANVDSSINGQSEVYIKFRGQLQALLKKMLQMALSASTNKSSVAPQATPINNSSGDVAKLRELYGMALKLTDLSQLHEMYELWSP